MEKYIDVKALKSENEMDLTGKVMTFLKKGGDAISFISVNFTYNLNDAIYVAWLTYWVLDYETYNASKIHSFFH